MLDSDASSGWAGWALAHPEFGVSVNPILSRGADYAHRITACPSGFENLTASLPGMKLQNSLIAPHNLGSESGSDYEMELISVLARKTVGTADP